MTKSRIMPACVTAAAMTFAVAANAQSSGMGVDLPAYAAPMQADVRPDGATDAEQVSRDCRDAQAILKDKTASSEAIGSSIDVARAQFDYLRSRNGGAWLFALQSVDAIYADPALMRQSISNGRWLTLCEGRLHDR